MRRMERMPVRPNLRLWTLFTSTPGTVVTMWINVFREGFGENRADLVQLGGQMTNSKDWNTAVKLRGHKRRHVHTTQTCNSVRSSEVGEQSWKSPGDRLHSRWSC